MEKRSQYSPDAGEVGKLPEESGTPAPECVKAGKNNVGSIAELVQKTISEVYPKYYPADVMEFFLTLHSASGIEEDVARGNVWMLLCGGRLAGTGSAEGNHITRVYVHPEMRGRGIGRRIMGVLEEKIKAEGFEEIELDASLPACGFYEKLGYRTVRHEQISAGEAVLVWDVMRKDL